MIARLLRLVRYRPGRIGKNTFAATAGLGARAMIQAGYIIALSRWIGVTGYGLFAGSVAAATLLAPLGNWGSGLMLTRHIARNRSSSRGMWATGLVQTGVVGSLFTIIVMLVSAWALKDHVGLGPMLLIALSELVFLPAALLANRHCFALERGIAAAVSMCLVPGARLATILIMMVIVSLGTPIYAAIGHFVGSVIGLAVAFVLVARIDGFPDWRNQLGLVAATREGAPYAIGNASNTSYLEFDKVLMLQLLGAAAVGPYTAAFRVMSVFTLPVAAIISAVLPRLFATHGEPGHRHTVSVTTIAALAYAVMAAIVAVVLAPWIPWVFGPGYEDVTHYMLLFAPWVVLYALHQCGGTVLTAIGRQSVRVVVELVGLILIVVSDALLLQRYGTSVAIWALLAGEAWMVVGCWGACWLVRFRT